MKLNVLPVTANRQFNEDARRGPAVSRAQLHPRREILYTRLAIVFSLVTLTIALYTLVGIIRDRFGSSHVALAAVETLFALNFAFLAYRIIAYKFNRLSFFRRMMTHRDMSREELESIYEQNRAHPVVILVPSYCEELRVLRMTLMSAALCEYPDRRVVLLIDNPPNPTDLVAQKELIATRELVRELDATFRAQRRSYEEELGGFEARRVAGSIDFKAEYRRLAKLYRRAARWLEMQAGTWDQCDHYDVVYTDRVLREPAQTHRDRADQLERHSESPGRKTFNPWLVAREYKRLAALFAVPLASFERKRFVNLSHACNKAMNLNSYIGLLGRSLREVVGPGGLHLEECEPQIAQLMVRDAEYIITLDADSMLLHDYALKLTQIAARPEAARYAVVQSPFTAVPGSQSLLERIAGAQTDVQWYSTQGATLHNGSFWVGANALLRRAALEDICETVYERGFAVKRYVHDRTLVEDTESTIDLIVKGWQIYCHPERLSYTATPGNFGALVIQRRRWANGPVLVLPKLARYAVSKARRLASLPETLLRLYTLTAVLGSASVLFIILVPFPDGRRFPAFFLLACMLPYYWLFCRDLVNCGYEWWDLPRVHAMDLLLIPVNLTGLLRSLRQAVTGKQSAFTRTPKIPGRTVAPAVQVLMPVLILAGIVLWTFRVMRNGAGFGYGIYGVLNATYLIYGIVMYIRLDFAARDIATSASARVGSWTDLAKARNRTIDLQTPSTPEVVGN